MDYYSQSAEKLDALVEEHEIQSLITVSQRPVKDFLMEEHDLYSASDLKVAHK